MSQIRKQGIYNMFFSYAGVGIGFFVTIFKTQALTSEEIGLISLLLSISSILVFGMLLGTPSIIMKFLPSVKDNDHDKMGFLLFLFFIPIVSLFFISIIFIVFRDFLINNYIENPELSKYYIFILLFTFFNGFFQIFDMTCRSLYKSVFPNFLNGFLRPITHLVILFIVYYYKLNFEIYFYMYFIIISLKTITLLVYLFGQVKIVKPNFTFINTSNIKKYFTYGLFMLVAGLAGTLTTKIDKIMLGYFNTLSNVGIYTIAITIGNVLGVIGGSVLRIAHPKISQAWEVNDLNEIDKIYKRTTNLQIYLGLFIFTLLFFFSDNILLFLGDNYIEGYSVLIFIALGQLINISAGMCGGIIGFSHYYKFDFYIRLVLIVINVIMNYLLIPSYGMLGAAIATAFSLGMYNILKVLFVYYKFSLQPYSLEVIKIIFAFIITSGMLYLFDLNYNNLSICYIILVSIFSFGVYNIILIFFLKSESVNLDLLKSFFK
jgi:O-antigen/teichoic acid export membrane protein